MTSALGVGNPGAAVHAILPDGEDIVPGSKLGLGPVAEADDVEDGNGQDIGLHGILVVELVTERFRLRVRQPVALVDLLHQR